MTNGPIRKRLVAIALALGLTIAAGAPALAAASGPATPPASPGALSIGDSLFPTLGNGGYDAQHYDFDLRFGTASTDPVKGTVTMVATATQNLSRFSLDFAGQAVGAITVNGTPAASMRTSEKLIITPQASLPAGKPFAVEIKQFVATPKRFSDDPTVVAFVAAPSGTETAPQPAYAHYAFPLNDHPSDKASYSFRLNTPVSETAVASGLLVSKKTAKGRIDWAYVQRQPLASELIQLAVGNYDIIDRGMHQGVKLRDVTVKSATSALKPKLGIVKSQLDWLIRKLGAYPFDTYGSLVTDQDLGFALETQTLSVYATDHFDGVPEKYYAPVMLHELSHQWWGNNVSPTDWSDIWLNEGHATYYENTYAEANGWLEDYSGYPTLPGYVESLYAQGDQARAEYGPVGRPLSGADADIFSPQSYEGGLVVLYALRQKIGVPAFERLERAWVSKYSGRSAGTQEFIALAHQVSGKYLNSFFNAWLYGTTTPPMPGHPDWTVDPVVPAVTARGIAPLVAVTGPLQLVRR